MSKWRIGVASIIYTQVELEASNPEDACAKALETVQNDKEPFVTGYTMHVTHCLINDRCDFVPYIPEVHPDEKK